MHRRPTPSNPIVTKELQAVKKRDYMASLDQEPELSSTAPQMPPLLPQTPPVGSSKKIRGTPTFEISHRPCKRVSLRETAMGPVSQSNM